MVSTAQRFRVRLERPEGYARGASFRVPPRVMASFAPRKRVPVVVTINDYSWRSTVCPYGGEFFVPVRSQICTAIGADAGDTVAVAIVADNAVRRVDIPDHLARTLDQAGARDGFDQLPFSEQKELVRAIGDAKRPETRGRRVQAAVTRALARSARQAR